MDNFGMQPPIPVKKTLGPPEQLYLPPKDNKKRTLVIVLCVCAAVLTVILFAWFQHTHSPSYRVQKGLLNLAREIEEMKNPLTEKVGANAIRQMMAEEGFSADTRLNVTFDTGRDLFGELTLGVDTEYEKDIEGKEMSSATTLSMMNYEFGHVDLYGNKDVLCFSCPEFLMDGMYIENENVLAQYNHSIWGSYLGELEGNDFSIELFADKWIFADEEGVFKAFQKQYGNEIEECGRHMTIERAGSELYRVSFDSLYFNELIRQMLYDYVDYSQIGREEAMGILSCFDVISNDEEISFLFAINGENRIESIRIEAPLSVYQGDVQISGDIYFLGAERSIEKMQGKIEIKRDREEEVQDCELTWQIVQSLKEEVYRAESNIRYSVTDNGEKINYGVDSDLQCDAGRDSFAAGVTVNSWLGTVELAVEGGLSHIQKGESFDLEIDEVTVNVDDEELFLVRGEVNVEPLARRVKKNVKPKKAFFEMTENDLYTWMDDMIDEYYYVFEGLLDSWW